MTTRRTRALRRRRFLQTLAGSAAALPLGRVLTGHSAPPAGHAKRVIFYYFPDGVPGISQNGDGSKWHCTGSEFDFQLSEVLQPLAPHKQSCVFLNGLGMGDADNGSHPGGAKKLLTGVDGGGGQSIDRFLAQTAGADAPHQMIYLGAQANQNGASDDKHISYVAPGASTSPVDDPKQAFSSIFGGGAVAGPQSTGPDPFDVTVVDGMLEDLNALRSKLGVVEKTRLDVHLDALHEVEKRIKNVAPAAPPATCDDPSLDTGDLGPGNLYAPERFPHVLRAQMDVAIQALACGLTRVATIQASHHTSELIMSRFEGTPMHAPNFDMRSHQASHYGAAHDPGKSEYKAFVQQRVWFVEQFRYLLDQLAARPEGDGSMLDHTLLVMCSEVSDGNTHSHYDMPFVLAGHAGGKISTGRLLSYSGEHHGGLLASIAHAMGEYVPSFGQGGGPLWGLTN